MSDEDWFLSFVPLDDGYPPAIGTFTNNEKTMIIGHFVSNKWDHQEFVSRGLTTVVAEIVITAAEFDDPSIKTVIGIIATTMGDVDRRILTKKETKPVANPKELTGYNDAKWVWYTGVEPLKQGQRLARAGHGDLDAGVKVDPSSMKPFVLKVDCDAGPCWVIVREI